MKIHTLAIFLILSLALTACRPQVVQPVVSEPEPPRPAATSSPTAALGAAESSTVLEQPTAVTQPVVQPEVVQPAEKPQPQVVASSFLMHDVAFASQAPFGVWDELHGEACEEASMIMAVNYFQDKPLDNHIMDQAILSVIKWQEQNGYTVDLTADEVVTILDVYFNQRAFVTADISVDNIIAELDKGNLIIVPAAGRNLGNPYFTPPGPVYHMLVIKGYDKKAGEFITNDPGTKRGNSYRYKYSRLLGAIAEWDHDLGADGMTQAEIEQGRKVLVVVTPGTN